MVERVTRPACIAPMEALGWIVCGMPRAGGEVVRAEMVGSKSFDYAQSDTWN
jgi:hypothetical protein